MAGQSNYRAGYSRNAGSLATFHRQMADFFARGEVLRELRKARHESQEHVAAEIGVTTAAYRRWEKGGGIHWENVEKAATYYEIDPDQLVARKDEVARSLLEEVAAPSQLDRLEALLRAIAEQVGVSVDYLEAEGFTAPSDAAGLPQPGGLVRPRTEREPTPRRKRPPGTRRAAGGNQGAG